MANLRKQLTEVYETYKKTAENPIRPGDLVRIPQKYHYAVGAGCGARSADMLIVLNVFDRANEAGDDCVIAFYDDENDLLVTTARKAFLERV